MIHQATPADLGALTELALLLWPHHSAEDLAEEFAPMLESSDAAIFLDWDSNTPIGFAQCQLRRDYVEGTETSPVGYLEGIFIREEYRRQGRARALLGACERWAASAGCSEFASDCELTNAMSLAFHLRVGFMEANRIICFTKKLGGDVK